MAGVALAALIPVVLVTGLVAAQEAGRATPAPPIEGCAGRMRLRPVEMPGSFWQQHRHRLGGTSSFNGSQYIIINMRTRTAHAWTFMGNSSVGLAVFAVPTRWAWFHPGWKDDPWLLAYDCNEPSGPHEASPAAPMP